MSKDNAYLYLHKKASNGEVFYVGIGHDRKGRPGSSRSHCKDYRNEFWHNVVDKHGFEVEIVIENLTWKDACEWEKLFIQHYGKRIDNTGTLVNITDGGDGGTGRKKGHPVSAETRKKLSDYWTGKSRPDLKGKTGPKMGYKHSEATKQKMRDTYHNKHN